MITELIVVVLVIPYPMFERHSNWQTRCCITTVSVSLRPSGKIR